MLLLRFMSSNPVTIEQDQSLADAYHLMERHDIRHLPVIDIYDRLLGIVTMNDLHRAVGLQESRRLADHLDRLQRLWAQDVMTSPAHSLQSEDDLTEAVDLMLTHKISAVPIIDDDRRLIGIITETDMLKILRSLLLNGAQPI